MSAPRFWWRQGRSGAALALWPAAKLYGEVAAWRMGREPRFRPPVPVVCVGNFVVGGAGKTPTCLALARIAAWSSVSNRYDMPGEHMPRSPGSSPAQKCYEES